MKTKEFIKAVEKLGFRIEYYKNPFSNVKSSDYDLITIYHKDRILVKVWTNCRYAISTISDGHSCFINGYDVDELYKVCFEYANTPVEDREEEKKYYLKHRYLQSSFTNLNNFLSYSASDDKLALSNGINFPKYKTHFTLKEIEEIEEKFDTDLKDFELIEVEE